MTSGSCNILLWFLKKQATLTQGNACQVFGEGWQSREKNKGDDLRREEKVKARKGR